MSRPNNLFTACQIMKIEDPQSWVLAQYNSGKSCAEIAKYIFDTTGVVIQSFGIRYWILKLGTLRTKKESFALAVASGRMDYKNRSPRTRTK